MEKYITRDDYLIAKGVDLELELQDDDNPSRKVERLIEEITDWCVEHLTKNYQGGIDLLDFDKLSEIRQKYFRKGVIEQIEYVLRNGFTNKDSGYNSETGVIVDLSKIALSPNAKQKFWMGGFANICQVKRRW